MKSQIKLLSLVVRATVILLACSAVLVVLSVFNEALAWDIFSPEAEKILYALFGSLVALAGFGAAISIVLGIQEMVSSVRRLVDRAHPEAEPTAAEAPRRRYMVALAALLAVLVVTVMVFSTANGRITKHRIEVFKLVAQDQMRQLGPKLAAEVAQIQTPCEACVTPTLLQFFRTMGSLSFLSHMALYLPDPQDDSVLWRFASEDLYSSSGSPKMERFFIAKDDDRAIKLALSGDPAWINQKNGGDGFTWYHLVKDAQGHTRAVLVLDANQQESFREYAAGAEAEKKRSKSG
jgi:hypothetical protein